MKPRTPTRSLAVLLLALAMVAAACGGSSSSSSSGPKGDAKTLKLAFNADMQVPDPDIFYEVEGNAVVTSVYEGLVRYKPNTTAIEPALAESWTVSPEGTTYTFKLRAGVKFADGTPMDAQSWIVSFKRRTDVNSAPAYMLANVGTTAAPDPTTFVVTLTKPVTAFLDYMAAPYGPKAVSPIVLKDHAGSDFAQNWLKSHSAGTGPYAIAQFSPGTKYQLKSNPNYWGSKPYFTAVDISIIPDVSTQRLKLEGGDLDMVMHGLPVSDVEAFRKNPKFTVNEFPALIKTVLAANPNKGAFKDKALRLALQHAFDKNKLVEQIYQKQADPSTQLTPVKVLPTGTAKDPTGVDTAELKKAVAKIPAPDRNIDMAYSADEGGTIPRLAEVMATTLQDSGLTVKVRAMPIAQVFDLVNKKDGSSPDLLLWSLNPDAAHPDTWMRIFNGSNAALNFLICNVPEGDAKLDQGLSTTDTAASSKAYEDAADIFEKSGCWTDIADNKEIVVARKGITGFTHQLPTAYTVRLADLKEG